MPGALTRYHPETRLFGLGQAGLGAEIPWGEIITGVAEVTGEVTSAVGAGITTAQQRAMAREEAEARAAMMPWIIGGIAIISGAIVLAVALK